MEQSKRLPIEETVIGVLIGLLLLLISCFGFIQDFFSPHPPSVASFKELRVSVEGAVESPGVYTLSESDRVADLLKLAQPTAEADLSKIRKQKKMQDGQVIKVPEKKKGKKKDLLQSMQIELEQK